MNEQTNKQIISGSCIGIGLISKLMWIHTDINIFNQKFTLDLIFPMASCVILDAYSVRYTKIWGLCLRLTFISSFKFKFLAIATVSCCSPESYMKYVLGGWFETCDNDTWSLWPCGRIAELLILLRDRRRKNRMWHTSNLSKLNFVINVKLHSFKD